MAFTKNCLVALCIVTAFNAVACVNRGDDRNAMNSDGVFLAFADKTIHIINPQNLSIALNISKDENGNDLSKSDGQSKTWGDVVFSKNSIVKAGLAFINEADQYTVDGEEVGYVTVVQTGDNPKIVGRVQVGGRPNGIFNINSTNSVWTRSAADGKFYIVSVKSLSPFNATVNSVPAFTSTPDDGILVISPSLSPFAYGTNVAEQRLYKYNLTNETLIGSFSFSQLSNCTGLNTAVYSSKNKHVLAQCVEGGGILEWDTVSDKLVGQNSAWGKLSVSPAGDRIISTHMMNSSSTVMIPQGNGEPTKVGRVISVPGQPEPPIWYSNSTDNNQNYTAYTRFYPLAMNTNKFLIEAVGNTVTDLAYYKKPTDCQYESSRTVSTAKSSTGLKLATASNGSVITPNCGGCAPGIATDPGNPEDFFSPLAGFGVLILKNGNPNITTVSAGAVQPAMNFATDANQCSLAKPSRAARRGGGYIATVADLPQPSVYIVPGTSPTNSVSFVFTAPHPRKLVWAPNVSF